MASSSCQNSRPTTRLGGYKVDKNIYLTATKCILPNELSQFSLSPSGFASNACTVISELVGLRFLQNLQIPVSDRQEKLQITLQQYRGIMIKGNTLYSIINPRSHKPNLTVEDVLASLPFPLERNAICSCEQPPVICCRAFKGK